MPQLSLRLGRAHENRQLFSNHFLEERLRRDPVWEAVAPDADALRLRLRELFAGQAAVLPQANERQTEERWIGPVLRELGWGYEVQPKSRRQGTTQFPDYALFPSQAAADAAANLDPRRLLKNAAGVLEAKRWSRSLDDRGGAGDEDPNRVPSAQIINYLIRAEQPWGILTNGQHWRIYHRDADFADTVFYGIDLPALLEEGRVAIGDAGETVGTAEAFRYFYLFFRPAALEPEPDGRRWLDHVRESSSRYARAVEEELKPRAYRAVTALCRGFVAAAEGDAETIAADPRRGAQVLDNALTLLFRLLFLLYAESRDLLPVRANPAYRGKSLLALRERAAEARDQAHALFPRGQDLWRDLQDLCEIVDGDPKWAGLGIPVYNGGLFDPQKHPWLERNYVADPELAEALDLLSRVRDPDTGETHFVDYGPLDVRHLGSIYEGLLEYVLRVASRDLPPITLHGRTMRDAVPRGALYLATDRGERHTTGSFYTPDYIVQYIVEQTLGPLVEGRTLQGILDLKVLDPAMGSGHFLVAATSYLARAAVRAGDEHPQQLLGDFARFEPEHLRRIIVERCIFGVDRNPRAVELAKLALWLATVRHDKPLSFLDHHLRTGNSLVGARVARMGGLPVRRGKEAVQEQAGQVGAFEGIFREALFRALGFIHQIERLPSDSEPDVKRKEELFAEADGMLDRFRDVAAVWASALFGNRIEVEINGKPFDRLGDEFARAVESLRTPDEEWEGLRSAPWFAKALTLAEEHRFFAWEIEFPEVFYEESGRPHENPGFDAVVGNPPYVRMEKFKELKDFLRAEFGTYETRSDLYVYFVERSLDLLRAGGEYGVIISNKFLRANYGAPLRALLGRRAAMREIVDFGGLPVFEDATVRAAILVVHKGSQRTEPPRFAPIRSLDFSDLREEVEASAFPLSSGSLEATEWRLVPGSVAEVLQRMDEVGEPLGSYAWGLILRGIPESEEDSAASATSIGWGIKTGLNEAFFIDGETRDRLVAEDPDSTRVIKPLVVGEEVRRSYVGWRGQWLIYLPHGSNINAYPAIQRHLEPFRDRLEARATQQAWYEIQQPQRAYIPFFDGPKILYPEIASEPRFAFHPGPLYPNNKCFFIPGENSYLLALLNSRLVWFYIRHVAALLESRSQLPAHVELRAQYMERLPIPPAPARASDAAAAETRSWLEGLYFRGLRRAGLEPEVPEELRQLGTCIGEIAEVQRVVLIGSWARGHAREDSDVDLLVVLDRNGSPSERRRIIREHVGRCPRTLDLHVYTPEELRERAGAAGGFEHHVMEEGVPLYERP
jgi:predicted nucleotidyltransferase